MMRTIKKSIFYVALMACGFSASAQQDPQYSQYMFNTLVINPAYAGYTEEIRVDAISRTQWTGIDGAPKTQTLVLDGSFFKDKVGLGISLIKDKIGFQSQTTGYLNYAYRVKVQQEADLAFGLGVGVGEYKFDGSGAITDNPSDPHFPYGNYRKLSPDTRAGIFYSNNKYYAGISVTNMFSSLINIKNTEENIITRKTPEFFVTGGTIWPINDFLKWKPSFLVKNDFRSPMNVDLNNFLLLSERLWIGASYRTSLNVLGFSTDGNVRSGDAIVGMVETFEKNWRFGYAFDYSVSALFGRERGSHEISIGYVFRPRQIRILTPRYF